MELDSVSKTLTERRGARLPASEDVSLSYRDHKDMVLVPGQTDGPVEQNEQPRNNRRPRLRTVRLQTGSGERGLDFMELGHLGPRLTMPLKHQVPVPRPEGRGWSERPRGERRAPPWPRGGVSSGRPQDTVLGLTMLEKESVFQKTSCRKGADRTAAGGKWSHHLSLKKRPAAKP